MARRAMPRRADLGLDDLLDDRVGQGRAVALLVAVPAGAGLLAEAAALAELVEDFRDAHVAWQSRRLSLADAPAHVVAGHVAHREQAHRQAEFDQDLVDLLRQGAFLDQEVGLLEIAGEHAVADEAVAYADQHRHLAQRAAELHGRRDHVLGARLAAHHLEQAHDIRRAEEVRADDVRRAAASRRRSRRRRGSRCWWPGWRRACTGGRARGTPSS